MKAINGIVQQQDSIDGFNDAVGEVFEVESG